jgi:hypothetical protein
MYLPLQQTQFLWALHSKVLAGYLEVVDQWEGNALLGVL